MKNGSDKIKTHFMFKKFFPENLAVYAMMWKNIVEPGRPQMTVWRMRIACCIPKATGTHSDFVMIDVLSLQFIN